MYAYKLIQLKTYTDNLPQRNKRYKLHLEHLITSTVSLFPQESCFHVSSKQKIPYVQTYLGYALITRFWFQISLFVFQ